MPPINISAYWILRSMFLVYYTAIMQFSIASENSLYPLQKFNLPDNTNPLLNQNFLTCHKTVQWNLSLQKTNKQTNNNKQTD